VGAEPRSIGRCPFWLLPRVVRGDSSTTDRPRRGLQPTDTFEACRCVSQLFLGIDCDGIGATCRRASRKRCSESIVSKFFSAIRISDSPRWVVPIAGETCATERYNIIVITRGIRELVGRDWAAARENKDAYWGRRIASLGAAESLRIADQLRRQVILRDPNWPDAGMRQADVLLHVRLAEQLRRAGPTRRR
jgi:hypothetical protein